MSLAENTKTALDESRTLMLGAQILLGFQLQAPFQSAFVSLMWHEKAIEVAVLCIMVLVLGLLIAPSARHRIVEQGEATAGINRFITRMSVATLFPFAIALALDPAVPVATTSQTAARFTQNQNQNQNQAFSQNQNAAVSESVTVISGPPLSDAI